MKLVYIEWHDAVQPIPEWESLTDIGEPTLCQCKSVGWIISEDSISILLAPNIADEDTDDGQCSGRFQIPKSAIHLMVEVNLDTMTGYHDEEH